MSAIWGCAHSSLSGIDTTPLDDPGKLWRCHECDEVCDQSGNVVPEADALLRILADLRGNPDEVPR